MNKIIFFFTIAVIIVSGINSQTPYYSIKFSMIDTSGEKNVYSISERICRFDYKPFIRSGDYWFGKDTSALDWDNLPDSMYNLLKCDDKPDVSENEFKSGGHQMVWENIYIFTISKTDPGSAENKMIIVFPVLVKSFVTYIDLGKIEFKKGYYELTNSLIYSTENQVSVFLPEGFEWGSIPFENRKIRINN
jgi:hypothetical protein